MGANGVGRCVRRHLFPDNFAEFNAACATDPATSNRTPSLTLWFQNFHRAQSRGSGTQRRSMRAERLRYVRRNTHDRRVSSFLWAGLLAWLAACETTEAGRQLRQSLLAVQNRDQRVVIDAGRRMMHMRNRERHALRGKVNELRYNSATLPRTFGTAEDTDYARAFRRGQASGEGAGCPGLRETAAAPRSIWWFAQAKVHHLVQSRAATSFARHQCASSATKSANA